MKGGGGSKEDAGGGAAASAVATANGLQEPFAFSQLMSSSLRVCELILEDPRHLAVAKEIPYLVEKVCFLLT